MTQVEDQQATTMDDEPVALYLVDEDQADDPEAHYDDVLTADEIIERYPDVAALFVHGDGTESLTFCHELWQLRIRPLER